jgi:hypothetical protein
VNQLFDYFGVPEYPSIILCNPDGTELYSLGLAYNTQISLKFNALSEFTFSFPESIDGGQTILEAYRHIQNKRLVLINGYGYFMIDDAVKDMDGATPIKSVSCRSVEAELIQKKVTAYGGTKKLYDLLSPSGTILSDMLALAPTWSVGTVDAEILLKYRTFDVSNTNIYNFLTVDVANAFEAVFIFDNTTKTISAKTIDNATSQTDIFLSFDNVLKSASFSEKSDEITTCLSVYGGGDLNIRSVNPLGTDKIYDFSYYLSEDWMSSGLVTAVTAWNLLVATNQPLYASLLLTLQTYNSELLVLNSELATLTEDYLSLQGVQKLRIQTGSDYSDINVQMADKQTQIDSKNIEITNKNVQIADVTAQLQAINVAVSTYIYENTYKNENIIQTDSMTLVEIQAVSQSLYDQSLNVLSRISQPRYEIELEAVNYIALPEFSVFTTQTEMGCVVTAEVERDVYIQTVLLELSFTFDNPESFSMTFSNRVRLDDGNFTYSDLIGQVVKTGASVAFESSKWSNWDTDYKGDVTTFITSALDTTNNNLLNNANQEIIINQNGLRGRTYNESIRDYDPTQMWLTSSILAFTDNSWNTSKLALGKVSVGGTDYFGLVADVIVGRLLAGSSLTISNANNNFTLDETGAYLNNATLTIEQGNSRIFLDPTNGIKIQANVGGTWTNKFYVDGTGNVNFSGNLSGATGTFSGTLSASVGNIGTLVIDSLGLKTSDGANYLRGNGDLRWGGLSISGGSATFTGTIYADRLVGQVNDGQIAVGLSAGKVTNGTMAGERTYGGTATLYGINPITGTLIMTGSVLLTGGTLSVNGGIFGDGVSVTGGITANGQISASTYRSSGGNGISNTITITTPYGTRYMRFSGGILVSYYA